MGCDTVLKLVVKLVGSRKETFLTLTADGLRPVSIVGKETGWSELDSTDGEALGKGKSIGDEDDSQLTVVIVVHT